jgi:hypothetical protein
MSLPTSPRVAALLQKMRDVRGRLIFALDATASRENMWDVAAKLTSAMFAEAAAIGGLDVQLVHYGGCYGDVRQTSWLANAHELIGRMDTIRCSTGETNIRGIFRHVRSEHERGKVSAAIFIGDAVEETPSDLYAAAEGLGVPLFMFQEGDGEVMDFNSLRDGYPPQKVEAVFRELARMTGGAYGKFDAGAAKQLGDLLRAVAAFAVGGMTALADQRTDSARKLIGQMRR